MKKTINKYPQSDRLQSSDLLLLLGWLAIGMLIRFSNLGDKSASSIEIATLGFSLGHGFSQIPIDTIIPASTLLAPLKFDRAVTVADVVARLFGESTHPPLYFVLTHWWLELFSRDGDLVSLTVGRSLSAIFGGLAIPAIFGFSWITFRDRATAHFTAILMATSPYGIYLAQEARHYTLSILWIIISLTCMMVAINHLKRGENLPWVIVLAWICINTLGIATHYFFGLALLIQALILLGLWCHLRSNRDWLCFRYWKRIILAIWITLAASLIWIPIARGISSNELTSWIATDYSLDLVWLPIVRILGWSIAMVVLLPIEGTPIVITAISGMTILLTAILTLPWLARGWKSLINSPHSLNVIILTSYCAIAWTIFGAIIYGYGKDISLAARYHFIYFPVVLVLLGAILARLWQHKYRRKKFGLKADRAVILILVMSLLGSLTVVNNFGFQKSRQSNLLAKHIVTMLDPDIPTLVATSYETHSPLREAIALALSFQTNTSLSPAEIPRFLLLRQNIYSYVKFRHTVLSHTKPLQIWSINLDINPAFFTKDLNCIGDRSLELFGSGYQNRPYYCQELGK